MHSQDNLYTKINFLNSEEDFRPNKNDRISNTNTNLFKEDQTSVELSIDLKIEEDDSTLVDTQGIRLKFSKRGKNISRNNFNKIKKEMDEILKVDLISMIPVVLRKKKLLRMKSSDQNQMKL